MGRIWIYNVGHIDSDNNLYVPYSSWFDSKLSVSGVRRMLGLPNKKYKVIYADPPWRYSFSKPTASKGGNKGDGYSAGVNYYYDTMTLNEIKEIPINNLADRNAVLFLWATTPLLPEALETMKVWGFKYKSCITWKKERCKGMGYWFRGHTEHLLFGVKGKIKAFRSLKRNVQEFPVEKHSKKPDGFRTIIELVTKRLNPKIELFARQRHDGWDAWGDEVSNGVNEDEKLAEELEEYAKNYKCKKCNRFYCSHMLKARGRKFKDKIDSMMIKMVQHKRTKRLR